MAADGPSPSKPRMKPLRSNSETAVHPLSLPDRKAKASPGYCPATDGGSCVKQQHRLAGGPDRLALSLFTGAGGLDLGLEAAGFSVSICVEVDEDARRTLMANRSSWKLAEPGDIHRIEPDELLAQANLRQGDVALLVGGPPCQPFSKSAYWANGGARGLSDPRASTLRAYLKVVEVALPRVFLIEVARAVV